MEREQGSVTASKNTISRMPSYLRYLREESSKGVKYISSAFVAREMEVSAILVRKDFALVSSVSGKPRLGFEIERLISDIEKFLGYDNVTDAIVVGSGGLGKAFLGYERFKNYGMNIVAAFDCDEKIVGTYVAGKPIYDIAKLAECIKDKNINIGIITVPKKAAQEVCDILVDAGIKAIWNFAPVQLCVPEGIEVKNEDLAASLALLSSKLAGDMMAKKNK